MRRVFHVDGQLGGFRQGKKCACGLTQCRHFVSGDTMADQIKETVIACCATQLLQQLLTLFGAAIEQAEIDDRQGKRAWHDNSVKQHHRGAGKLHDMSCQWQCEPRKTDLNIKPLTAAKQPSGCLDTAAQIKLVYVFTRSQLGRATRQCHMAVFQQIGLMAVMQG